MALTASAKVFSHAPMIGALDRDEHGNAEADLVLVDEGHPALDHAIGFQALDCLPARRRRQSYPVADLGDGQRGVIWSTIRILRSMASRRRLGS